MFTALRHFFTGPVIVLLAVAAASGCAPNPNAPTSMTGTWVGTVVSSSIGQISYQLTLTQNGSTITGTFATTIAGQATSSTGSLTGTIQGSAFSAALSFGTCTRNWTATWSGVTLSGTYASAGTCSDTGTFTLTLE